LESFGHSNISNDILVLPNLKKSSILFWNGVQDAKIKREIIDWRLGRIAHHQKCFICNGVLSRKHAISCSGADVYLKDILVIFNYSSNLIDGLLNQYFINNNLEIYQKICVVIQGIKKTCLGMNIQEDLV